MRGNLPTILKILGMLLLTAGGIDLGASVYNARLNSMESKAVVNSLVKDIIMPPIGLALGKVDFANLYWSLDGKTYPSLKAAQDAGAATINYGSFINTVIVFVIVAFVVFLIGRKLLEPAAPSPDTKPCPRCGETVLRVAARCPHCTSEGI